MATELYNIENFDFDAHIDNLISIAESIEKNKITIVTGANGYGKSFLRKIMGQLNINEKLNFPKVASVSMERRTVANHNFSAFSSLAMDDPSDATSNHTCYIIDMMFNEKNRYYIIDEPEIGMGKEVLLGLINHLNQKISDMKSNGEFLGIMFITHSEFFIDHIEYDNFINLQNMSLDEWRNREIFAISPEKLKIWALNMFRSIEKRLRKIKESNKN